MMIKNLFAALVIVFSVPAIGQTFSLSNPLQKDSTEYFQFNVTGRVSDEQGVTELQQTFEVGLNLKLNVDRFFVRFQPRFALGDFGAQFVNYFDNSALLPPIYFQRRETGLGGNGSIGYRLGEKSFIDVGFASFSDKVGATGLLLNGTAAPSPFARFHWQGKRLSFSYLFQLLENKVELYPNQDQFLFSSKKGFVMHKIGYQNHWLKASVFEAVIWSVTDSLGDRYFDPGYLMPFVFYRPVEFQSGSSDNALIGADAEISLWNYKAYGQLVLDEFNLTELRKGFGWWAHKWAIQMGLSREFLGQNSNKLKVIAELNWVRPFTFTHSFPAQSTSHFGFALGHPLGNNFAEQKLQVQFQNSKWNVTGIASSIVLGNRSAEAGGNILQSSRMRASDYGNSSVNQGNKYAFMFLEVGRKLKIAENQFQIGISSGARLYDKSNQDFWCGIYFRKGIFQNNYAY